MKNKNLRTANILKKIAWYTLFLLSVLVFGFALLSGADDYWEGLHGIIENSPNALPWLGLMILVFFAWSRELTGGILITILGIVLLYFFNFQGSNFFWVTFLVTLLIPILGMFFILSWYLKKD